MRLVFFVSAMLYAANLFGQVPQPRELAHVPDGVISGESYTNDAIGVIFHIPRGWTANLDSGHAISFGKDPDGPANRCTRVLLRYESPRKAKGWFSAWGILFAIDPECLGAGPFPSSPETSNARIDDLANEIYKMYHPAPFFPPGTLDVSADRLEWPSGPVILYLRGKGLRNTDETDSTRKREPVPVDTEFVLTKGTKYWLGWAAVVDNRSRAELSNSTLQIKVP